MTSPHDFGSSPSSQEKPVIFLILMHDQSTMKLHVTIPQWQGKESRFLGCTVFWRAWSSFCVHTDLWQSRQELCAISATGAVVAGKSTLLKPVCAPCSLLHYHFPYVKSCGAACSLPGKWDLLLLGNLYLCVMFELPGEDGKSFIPVLVPFLGKVSIKSGVCFCCSSGILHRRLRITRFTGCFITAHSIFLYYLPYAFPVSVKEQKLLYASAGHVTDPLTLLSLNSPVTLISRRRSQRKLHFLFQGMSVSLCQDWKAFNPVFSFSLSPNLFFFKLKIPLK